ncbi:MAG: hypothetical protein ACHQYQ_10400, partial [Bacteriovoracales bacterium]
MKNLNMESPTLLEIKPCFENNKFIFSYTKGVVTGTELKIVESTPKDFVEFIKKNAKTLPQTFEQMREIPEEVRKKTIKNNSGYFISGECSVRNDKNVQSIYALPFDFDHCPEGITIEDISKYFDGYCHLAYTSFSHLLEGTPKFRVILFLKEPFLKEEDDLQDKVHRTLSDFLFKKKISWLGESEMYA